MKNDKFQADLYRYYGGKESLRRRLLRPLEVKYIYYFRKAEQTKNKFVYAICKWKIRKLSQKTQIQIPVGTQIGAGFYIGHTGMLVINKDAVIGKNVNFAAGVTIGQENRGSRKGCPTIGDEVWIGTNAVVVGRITIGNDVLIAPLSYVNFDVPSHSVVIGNPARVYPRDNATDGYLNRKTVL